MQNRIIAAILIAAGIAGSSFGAFAQQTLQPGPRGAVSQVSSSGFYVWVDGTVQRINLPSVGNFGYRAQYVPLGNVVANEKHDPLLDGSSIRGAIGYVFRAGLFPFAFGSNLRIEIGGSYVKANGKSFATNSNTDVAIVVANLQGVIPLLASTGCGGSTCSTPSSLTSDYRTWTLNLSGKSDFKSGPLTLTPSLAIFTADGRTQHNLAQQLFADGAPYPFNAGGNTYNMRAALDWRDWGTKVGIEAKYDANAWLSFGLGGTLGFARRSASLAANDSLLFPSIVRTFTSSVADSSVVTAMLAGAEASVVFRPLPNMSIKGFAGINYDNRLPGIAGIAFPNIGVDAAPSHLKFESETSYYAGGGIAITFAP